MNRYNRHIILSEIGEKGQQKLLDAKVLVIGAGGLGCPVLQYLAAAGIGTLGVIDFDTVEVSNLQRQVLFGTSSLGKNKAMAAKERLTDLNDSIEILAYPEKLSVDNALELFSQYDIIVDGSDNFGTRYLVNDACLITKKPWVYGAIFKFQGQVSVFNYENGPSYRCLFPNSPSEGTVPSCNEVGVLGVLPGIIGTLMANEAIKMILKLGSVLSGTLQIYDSLSSGTEVISVAKNQDQFDWLIQNGQLLDTNLYDFVCPSELNIKEISAKEALLFANIQFVDIRDPHEQPKVEEIKPLCIPQRLLPSSLDRLDPEIRTILFCQSGIRSKVAAAQLTEMGWNQVYSLQDGVAELKRIAQLKLLKT